MISKLIKGTFFKGLQNYLQQEGKDHEMLDNNMGTDDPKEQLEILNLVASQRPRLKKKVLHASISLEIDNSLSSEAWSEIGNRFMKHMGFEDAPYSFLRHKDKEHEHIHFICSRVDYSGNVVSDSLDYSKSMKFMRQIEKEYNLQILETPKLYRDKEEKHETRNVKEKRQRLQKKHQKLFKDKAREIVRKCIESALQSDFNNSNQGFTNFLRAAKKENLDVRTFSNKNNKVYGLTYKIKYGREEKVIKSSTLGKKYGVKLIANALNKELHNRQRIKNENEKLSKLIKATTDNVALSANGNIQKKYDYFKEQLYRSGVGIAVDHDNNQQFIFRYKDRLIYQNELQLISYEGIINQLKEQVEQSKKGNPKVSPAISNSKKITNKSNRNNQAGRKVTGNLQQIFEKQQNDAEEEKKNTNKFGL